MTPTSSFPLLQKALQQYGNQITQAFKANLAAKGIQTNDITFEISYNNVGALQLLLYMPAYYRYLDQGRKPGRMPPVAAIKIWVRAHAGTLRGAPINTLRPTKSNSDMSLRLAFAIAKNIAKKGTKPTHFYTDVFKPGAPGDVQQLYNKLYNALKQDIINQLQTKVQ